VASFFLYFQKMDLLCCLIEFGKLNIGYSLQLEIREFYYDCQRDLHDCLFVSGVLTVHYFLSLQPSGMGFDENSHSQISNFYKHSGIP
jgi:hypothetical protein